MNKILLFIFFSSLLILASCGADLKKSKPLPKEVSNSLQSECACALTYLPVCGTNHTDYENSCIAACYKVPVAKQGHCSCSTARMVCGDDGNTYNECVAQDMLADQTLTKIVKFADCSATSY